jgi:hypothetical protein
VVLEEEADACSSPSTRACGRCDTDRLRCSRRMPRCRRGCSRFSSRTSS